MTRRTILACALAWMVAPGCTPDVADDDPTPVVVAQFDPSAEPSPEIPSPTDLVWDDATGHLLVGASLDDSDLQKELSVYLSAMDGWHASMPATATFEGEVDPATVDGSSVVVLDITDPGAPVEVPDVVMVLSEPEDGEQELRIHPGTLPGWEPGRRYLVAVLGGEDGVRGADGEAVVPSSTFWFFRSPELVASCDPCEEGWHDVDGDVENGCEYECIADGDETTACDDGRDNDCDGRTDVEDPDCGDCYEEFCNWRDDDCDGEVDEDYDLSTDRLNCGECGLVCDPDHTCVDGACVCEGDCAPEGGGCTSHTSLVDDSDAGDLEEIRSENAEIFDILEAEGHDRLDVVLAWSFRTSTRTVIPFDPTIDDYHFPNDAYLSEDETRLEVPYPEGSTPAMQALLDRLGDLGGYSLTGPGWIRVVGPIDGGPGNLTSTAIIALNADDSDSPPRVGRDWNEERRVIEIPPAAALHSGTRYVVLPNRYIENGEGLPLVGSHYWKILSSPNPVTDAGGASLLGSASDEDAQDLEEGRQDYMELFEELEDRLALPRDYYLVGIVFTTRAVTEEMQALRQMPFDEGLPTAAVAPAGVQDPALVVPAGLPTGSLLGVVEGTIPGMDVLDPETREIDGDWAEAEIPFVLALPLAPPAGRSEAPVAIVQHDISGSRQDAFVIADALAAEGWATLAIDLPGHGGRGVCLEDPDCTAGACEAGVCSGGDLVTDGEGRPENAARVLMPVDMPFAAGDAFRQSALDLVVLSRSLRAADGPASLPGVVIDTGDVSFVGAGFGAMAGTIYMAVDPTVGVTVLSGAGGNLGAVAEGSSLFAGEMDSWIEEDLGAEAGTETAVLMRYCWSWAADPGDPGVWARHLVDYPLPDPDAGGMIPPRELLVQIPMTDEVIPYESLEFFYFSAGTSVYPEIFDGAGHGFLLDPLDPAGDEARAQAVEFVVTGGAP